MMLLLVLMLILLVLQLLLGKILVMLPPGTHTTFQCALRRHVQQGSNSKNAVTIVAAAATVDACVAPWSLRFPRCMFSLGLHLLLLENFAGALALAVAAAAAAAAGW